MCTDSQSPYPSSKIHPLSSHSSLSIPLSLIKDSPSPLPFLSLNTPIPHQRFSIFYHIIIFPSYHINILICNHSVRWPWGVSWLGLLQWTGKSPTRTPDLLHTSCVIHGSPLLLNFILHYHILFTLLHSIFYSIILSSPFSQHSLLVALPSLLSHLPYSSSYSYPPSFPSSSFNFLAFLSIFLIPILFISILFAFPSSFPSSLPSQSIRSAVSERRGIYWSRSRGGLWRKGDTSGMHQVSIHHLLKPITHLLHFYFPYLLFSSSNFHVYCLLKS